MLTPAQVAKKAQVSGQTIRNYSSEYAELLSPTARGENGPRLYTDEDVQILCAIAELRKARIPPSEVVERLQSDIPTIVDVESNEPLKDPQEPAKTGQEALLAPQMVVSSLQAHLQATDATVQALQRQIELVLAEQKAMAAEQRAQLRSEKWWNRLEGAIGGLVLAGFLLWLGWSLVNGAPW